MGARVPKGKEIVIILSPYPPNAARLVPMSDTNPTVALVVAAGRGQRAGQGLPKQYRKMPGFASAAGDGDTVLAHSLSALAGHEAISRICVVIHKDDVELYKTSINNCNYLDKLLFSYGGETRQQSVLNGLEALAAHNPARVLIHDAARPYLSQALITRCLDGLDNKNAAKDGVIPALPVTDTLKRAENNTISATIDRDGLYRAQTPQAFIFDKFYAAHQKAPPNLTDDAAVAEHAGLTVGLVDGETQNIKLTTEEDFAMNALLTPRTGTGFDVHRFGEASSATEIMLCGVAIPHSQAIIGHSDADVGLHAITDAVLGALAAGDIGDHFPPSDAANKDRPSSDFLAHALALAAERSARLTHIDLTLICEAPKIAPHRDAMQAQLSKLTGLKRDAISVKATTTEGLGFTGRGEGIAAQAIATLLLADD